MEYIVITLAGLALAAASFYVATLNIGWTLPKALYLLSGGAFVGGLIGFLLWLTPFPFPGTVAVGSGIVAAIVGFAANLAIVPPAETWFFAPALFKDPASPFDIRECRQATSGLNLIIESGLALETFSAAIPMGRVVLDGFAEQSDPPRAGTGVIEVRCRDGSEAYIPIRIESAPLFSDQEALGRFIESGTLSGADLADHQARLAVIFDRWRTVITGPLEEIGKAHSPSELTRNVVQRALEAPTFQDAEGWYSYLDLVRDETYALGMNPDLACAENPQGLIVRVGDVKFSTEAEETLASRAVNAMIADTAAAIFAKLAPTSREDEMSFLLFEQDEALEALKAETLTDLDAERAKLLAEQRKAAARRKRVLEAKKVGMSDPAVYAASLAGAKGNVQKMVTDYRGVYEELLVDLAEAEEDEKSDELLGEFKVRYAEAKNVVDEKKSAIKKMEAASAAGRLTGEFKARYEEYDRELERSRSLSYRLAAAGEDANFVSIAGLEGLGGNGVEGLRAVGNMMEARLLSTAKTGGGK